ncbi:NUDIX hydrolase [Salibacterium aidingense]|uniref:NUDIX hydrolase n=1 Tax=Salibacterium aidingense TaxID=384933 RepID=UPI003BC041A7
MQRVTNCILHKDKEVLLLQKPSRNWWVAPGGKMEAGESVREAAVREFREETGITVKDPVVRGIFTFVIIENKQHYSEWMMFTFEARKWSGTMLEQSPEGRLEWMPVEEVLHLPMAAGDRSIFQHIFQEKGVLYGTFHYTPDYQLIRSEFQKDE